MRSKLHEREDRLGVDRHVWLCALDVIASEQRIVVQHDSVVDADDRAVPDGVIVRLDVRVTLCEVAHVNQRLLRLRRNGELVEERARTAAELRHARVARCAAMGISDGVRAALGDPGQKRLGSERPVDGRLGIEAESGYSAHSDPALGSDFSLT